jgi:hypothetical protein
MSPERRPVSSRPGRRFLSVGKKAGPREVRCGPVSSLLVSRMRGCRDAASDSAAGGLGGACGMVFCLSVSSASLPAARAQTTVALKFVQLNTKE